MLSLLSRISRPKTNNQHNQMHERIGSINRAVYNNAPHEELQRLIQETQKYLSLHFKTEEKLMRAINYPNSSLDAHKAAHSEALQGLRQLLSDSPMNNSKAKKIFEFLFDWTHVHELTEDLELSQFLKDQMRQIVDSH